MSLPSNTEVLIQAQSQKPSLAFFLSPSREPTWLGA